METGDAGAGEAVGGGEGEVEAGEAGEGGVEDEASGSAFFD